MVYDQGHRRGLGHELEGRGEREPDAIERQEARHEGMIVELGNCRVAPRIALALIASEPELAPDPPVYPRGRGLGGLDRVTVHEVGLRVLGALLQLGVARRRRGTHRHGLDGHDVVGAEVIGQAQPLAV